MIYDLHYFFMIHERLFVCFRFILFPIGYSLILLCDYIQPGLAEDMLVIFFPSSLLT